MTNETTISPGPRGEPAGGRDHVLHRHLAGAAGPRDLAHGPCGDQRRHAVGGGRAVAEVAAEGGAPLDLGRADQLQRLDHAGPGRLDGLALAEHSTGDRRADADFRAVRAHLHEPGDALEIDDQAGPHQVGAQLDEEVRAAGERPGLAIGIGEKPDGVLHRLGRLVS